jgi:cytochrome c peroxidase
MHNGAFVRLDEAVRYHLDAVSEARGYDTRRLPPDLQGRPGPVAPVLDRLDPLLRSPIRLTPKEFEALVAFVRDGLLDRRARPERLRRLIPERLPSGRASLIFQF